MHSHHTRDTLQRKVLDSSLGFAAGVSARDSGRDSFIVIWGSPLLLKVMIAASYWSLLEPAIEMADLSGVYGAFAFVPVVIGFVAGAAFVYLADVILPHMVRTS